MEDFWGKLSNKMKNYQETGWFLKVFDSGFCNIWVNQYKGYDIKYIYISFDSFDLLLDWINEE